MLRIDPSVFRQLDAGGVEGLKQALQHAIELEHATMPPYLYAMYSLGAANRGIRRVLRTIVLQEMLHMLLAGNMLKAVGGQPMIDRQEFVPDYPTHLPGTVAGELIVPLRPFSRDLAETVFMRLEQPERPLLFPTVPSAGPTSAATIGEFYARIRKVFEDEGDAVIVDKTGATQPETPDFAVEQVITTAEKAKAAIDVIVEQGEGTSNEPFFPDGDDRPNNDQLAHYYRFAEIVKGRLKRNPAATPTTPPAERYFYDSRDPVPFDQSLVLPLPENPKAAHYPSGSPAQIANDAFNRAYTRILKSLHDAFNRDRAALDVAIDIMRFELVGAATDVTAIEVGPGMSAGPSFEYLP